MPERGRIHPIFIFLDVDGAVLSAGRNWELLFSTLCEAGKTDDSVAESKGLTVAQLRKNRIGKQK